MAAKKVNKKEEAKKSVLAKTDDGTVQLTLTVPYFNVQETREHVLNEMLESLEIPGFRKGKAPSDLAMQHIDKQRLYERTLQHILPDIYANAVVEHKLQPVLAPRFELVSVEEEKDWTIRAITCEAPEVSLADYKKEITDKVKAENIWVPGKAKNEKKESSREEKEQQAIKTLLEATEVKIPNVLIEEEVNHRLSQLLDQIQRLGLTVEQYLSSTAKTIEQVRGDYANQARESIKLVMALNKVAEDQSLEVSENEIDSVIKVSENATKTNGARQEHLNTPDQRRLVRSVLLRRKALDSLLSLI